LAEHLAKDLTMPNPDRPTNGETIADAWGRAVADSVVRVYPNAATRDADLTGFTAADLRGQVTYLEDLGAVEVHDGPGGWRKPWNLPWGLVNHHSVDVGTPAVDGGGYTIINAPCTGPQGRAWHITATFQVLNGNASTASRFTAAFRVGNQDTPLGMRTLQSLAVQTYVYDAVAMAPGGTANVAMIGWAADTVTNLIGQARLQIVDVGPWPGRGPDGVVLAAAPPPDGLAPAPPVDLPAPIPGPAPTFDPPIVWPS
jgi:hypothetical protein